MRNKKSLLLIGTPLLLLTLVLISSRNNAMDSSSRKISNRPQSTQSFNKKRLSIDDPSSIWVITNKTRPLNPANYQPADLIIPTVPLRYQTVSDEMKLRRVAADALQDMSAEAKKESVNIKLASGYRSYSLQNTVYNNYVNTQGQATADTQSARPGFSEHQTGLAADLEPVDRSCEIEDCFATTKEGLWLAANSYKFGYVLRYPPNKQSVTGYKYEPWHFRYVGRELAAELYNQNSPTLEEFFNLTNAPDYN